MWEIRVFSKLALLKNQLHLFEKIQKLAHGLERKRQ